MVSSSPLSLIMFRRFGKGDNPICGYTTPDSGAMGEMRDPPFFLRNATYKYVQVDLEDVPHIYLLYTCQQHATDPHDPMTTTFVSLAQVSCTAAFGWLLVKWLTAKRVARETKSVIVSNNLSLILTSVVRQLVSASGCHSPSPSISLSRTCLGLNLSIQRTDGVFLC